MKRPWRCRLLGHKHGMRTEGLYCQRRRCSWARGWGQR